ncbi:MAG: hypothetical protein GXP32_01095 [Kiritimatiellaeota bacterium]|nr:hypothetical protein [Kiritimatiellota bacterium]
MDLFEKVQKDFPVQTAAVINAERNGRLSHAYIIHSDDELTRSDFSTFIACVAACPNSSDGRPCGVCDICAQLANGIYPELFSLMPESKSRKIIIGKNSDEPGTMRWFQDNFHLTSVSGGRKKVGIIHDADCANGESQNAFLKTLEEPPSASIFLLNTEKPLSLLTTIRSRCHSISLLRNQCDYQFDGVQAITAALFNLQICASDRLSAGEAAATVLLDVSSSLKKQAEARVAPKWEGDIAKMTLARDEADGKVEERHWNSMLKMFCERCDSAGTAEYLGLRMVFTSLIHTWFAQTYQLSCGAELNDLSAPFLYDGFDIGKLNLPEEKALRHLRKAEELLANLRWSVNEELAFREFCVSLAVAS